LPASSPSPVITTSEATYLFVSNQIAIEVHIMLGEAYITRETPTFTSIYVNSAPNWLAGLASIPALSGELLTPLQLQK
jgi:hypothetical protein